MLPSVRAARYGVAFFLCAFVVTIPGRAATVFYSARPLIVQPENLEQVAISVATTGTKPVVFGSGTPLTVTTTISWTAGAEPAGSLTLSDSGGTLNTSLALSSCIPGANQYTCTYTWTTPSAAVGGSPDTVTADYAGDTSYASAIATTTVAMTHAASTSKPTAMTLTNAPNTVVQGATTQQTFTFVITGSATEGVPSGEVMLWAPGALGKIAEINPLTQTGCATVTRTITCSVKWNSPATLLPGSYQLTASYSGSTTIESYTAVDASLFTVTPSGTGATATTVTANPSTLYDPGEGTTFTAVTKWTGSGQPTGSIQITGPAGTAGGGPLGAAVFPAIGQTTSAGSGTYDLNAYPYSYNCTLGTNAITCTVVDSDVYDVLPGTGANAVTAAYSGDTDFAGSSGAASLTLTFGNDLTSHTTVSPNPPTADYGAETSVAYTVSIDANSNAQPTGTVTLSGPTLSGGEVQYAVNATNCPLTPSYGQSNCVITQAVPVALDPGTYKVTAQYSGDVNFAPSTGAANFTVTGNIPTSTTVSANPTSITYGATVTFTSVTAWTGSGATPTGTVNLTCAPGSQGDCINLPAPENVSSCSVSTANQTLTCTIAYNTPGNVTDYGAYQFEMVYSGDTDYAGSYSIVGVGVGGADASTSALTAGANPSATYGATAIENFAVNVAGSAGDGKPTGTVTVSGGGTLGPFGNLGIASVSATCAETGTTYTCPAIGTYNVPATAAIGVYTLTFNYSGNRSYMASSAQTTLTITKPTPAAAVGNQSGGYESIVTLSATDTGVTGEGAPSGAVTFTVNGTTVPGAPSCTVATNVETCTLAYMLPSTLVPGNYPITATFAADTNYNASNTASATLTVTGPPPCTATTLCFTSVSHNFGQVQVGTAAAAYGIQVSNPTPMAYPFLLIFTPANGFTAATNCPARVAAGGKCELVFYFTPQAATTVSTTWSLASESGFSYSPSNGGTLSGAGSPQGGVALTSAGHNFGTVMDGTMSATYGTELSNSTNARVTLTLGSLRGTEFTVLTNCGATLAAGASCELEFTFKPTAPGGVQAVYTISSLPVAITSGGKLLAHGGITLNGTGQ